MATCACSADEGGALFFDFAAAFPSIEHSTLFAIFRWLRWPSWLINFLTCLCSRNECYMALGGSRHAGFRLDRGIRQ
eukprot:841905-Pyramimonas_sp.AAC.1